MSRSKSPTLSHRLEYFVFRTVECLLRMMSLETTFRLGEFAGKIVHRLLPRQRATVIRNLRFAFGDEKSRSEIDELAAKVFERTGANLFCSIRIPFLENDQVSQHLTVEGLDHLLATTDQGGIVAVSPHMGNWEILAHAAYLARDSFQVGTHYRPLNNQLLDALVARRRKKRGLKLFAKRSSAHTMASFVKSGGFLGILADQRVGSRGTPCVFFGRPTTCSPLPDLMARRSKARIFSFVCETIEIAQWKITLTQVPALTAQACATSLEEAWRRSPEDVFWFEARWRLQGRSRLDFLEKYKLDHQVTRPLRLVNLTSPEKAFDISEDLLTQEYHDISLDQSDRALRHDLDAISNQGTTPVDVFIAPPAQLRRLSRLTGKVLILSPEPSES